MKKLEIVLCILMMCNGLSTERIKAFEQEEKEEKENSGAFGFEILFHKIEYLQQQLMEQQLEMRKQNELILSIVGNKFSDQELKINQQNGVLKRTLDSLQQNIESKFSDQESKINQQNGEFKGINFGLGKIWSTVTGMRQKLSKMSDSVETIRHRMASLPLLRSCKDDPIKQTGQFLLKPLANEKPFVGFCEQDKNGGGWLVFQNRFDGSVDFFRNWTEYRNGFGQMDGEFWLGLEQLHRLTKGRKHTLMIELEDFDGKYGHAIYDGFEIGGEQEKYSIKVLGTYSGTAGDSLSSHQGQKFTTFDNDNDLYSGGNCATKWKGAWWYRNCYNSHLNGEYSNTNKVSTNFWYIFQNSNSTEGFKVTRMMVREN